MKVIENIFNFGVLRNALEGNNRIFENLVLVVIYRLGLMVGVIIFKVIYMILMGFLGF